MVIIPLERKKCTTTTVVIKAFDMEATENDLFFYLFFKKKILKISHELGGVGFSLSSTMAKFGSQSIILLHLNRFVNL